MAKTEKTLLIEQCLRSYSPDMICGKKLNKFRPTHLAYECVVSCGTIKDGIVDLVRVDEILINEERKRTCSCGYHPSFYARWHAGKNVGNCQRLFEDLPEYCDDTSCIFNSYCVNYDNDILITCYEIKITKEDFYSVHGHNFVGNCNYYVMPKEVYQQVKQDIPEDIGVIVFTETEKTRRLRRATECSYKHLDDTTRMWMLLNVLERVRK